MKRIVIFSLTFLLLLGLYGCGSATGPENQEEDKVISQAIALLSMANSFDYIKTNEDVTTYGEKQIILKNSSEVKMILDPYVGSYKSDLISKRLDNKTYRSISELYVVSGDKQIDRSMRSSSSTLVDPTSDSQPVLSNWEKNSITDPAQVTMIIGMIKTNIDAQLYLLSANIDSFDLDTAESASDENTVKYDGSIDPDTVLKAYQLYLRDSYVKDGRLPKLDDPSLDVLKSEITGGTFVELQSLFTKLAYTDTPTPISIWINKDTNALEKVVIDESMALQALLEIETPKVNPGLGTPLVNKSVCTFEIAGIDTLKSISMPE